MKIKVSKKQQKEVEYLFFPHFSSRKEWESIVFKNNYLLVTCAEYLSIIQQTILQFKYYEQRKFIIYPAQASTASSTMNYNSWSSL